MSRMPDWPATYWLLAGFPLLCGLAVVVGGQTTNWDLLNYHLYNPHALLSGRSAIDIAPAQGQSYFNPLLYIPYYLGYQSLPHPLLGFLLGAVQGLLIVPLFALARICLPDSRDRLCLLLAVLGLLGPMALSELGATFGDNLLAILLVGALVLILKEQSRPLLAGLLGGVAAGLKLVMVIYWPGLVLAVLATAVGTRIRELLWLGCGLLAGFVLCAGWWMAQLYADYGNPLFPYFNDVFRSDWVAPQAFRDTRWIAGSIGEAVLKPIVAAIDYTATLELKFRGPRVLLLFLSILALPFLAWTFPLQRRATALILFCTSSFLAWGLLLGYYRYLTPLEAVAPLALALIWMRWAEATSWRPWVVPALIVATQLAVKKPDWGRDEFGALNMDLKVPPHATVVVGGIEPVGWMALQLPADVPVLRVAGNIWGATGKARINREVRARLDAAPGPLIALTTEGEIALFKSELDAVELTLIDDQCEPLQDRPFKKRLHRYVQCPVSRVQVSAVR